MNLRGFHLEVMMEVYTDSSKHRAIQKALRNCDDDDKFAVVVHDDYEELQEVLFLSIGQYLTSSFLEVKEQLEELVIESESED